MYKALLRAARLTFSPGDEWRAVTLEEPRPRAIVTQFVLPLALIPSLSWPLGLLLFGNDASGGQPGVPAGTGQIIRGGLLTYFGVVLTAGLYAVAIVLLSPLYARPRNWQRALQVAVYSAAPVLLGGVLLILPNLVFALIVPFFHSLYLQYSGLQHVLGVKEGDAAEYVAICNVVLMLFSTAAGAFGMWLGGI